MGNSLETYILIVLLIKSKFRNDESIWGIYWGNFINIKKQKQAYSKEEMGASDLLLCFLICTLVLTRCHALVTF